jgi:hypothetical protein
MISKQDFFNQACDSLRKYGNQFGSFEFRKWGWCNPDDLSQRCAIARFVAGDTDKEIELNLQFLVGNVHEFNPLIKDITHLFDFAPIACNDHSLLDSELKRIADKYGLVYEVTTPKSIEILELV